MRIKLLKYILKSDKSLGIVEIKDFLLNSFPEKDNYRDRKEMRNLVSHLVAEGLIEKIDSYGLNVNINSIEAISRKEISVTVRIKNDGIELINKCKSQKQSKLAFGTAIVSAIAALFFGINDYLNKENLQKMEKNYSELIEAYDSLQFENDSLKVTNDFLKKENLVLKEE